MEELYYKGFRGTKQFSVADKTWYGKLLTVCEGDLVSYEGESVAELVKDFQAAVDDYIEDCAKSEKVIGKYEIY